MPQSALPVTGGNKNLGLFYVSNGRATISNHLGEDKERYSEELSGCY